MNNAKVYESTNNVMNDKKVQAALKASEKEFTSLSQVVKFCGLVAGWKIMQPAFEAVGIKTREEVEFKNLQKILSVAELVDKKGKKQGFGMIITKTKMRDAYAYDEDGTKLLDEKGQPIKVKVPMRDANGKPEKEFIVQACNTWTPAKLVRALAQVRAMQASK